MSKEKTYSDDDIKKFLAEKVKRSGFSLENSVVKMLKQNYRVEREVPFYDKEFEIGRNIDVVARTFIPDLSAIPKGERWHVSQLCLVIECKNIPGNVWVFAKDDPPEFLFPSFISQTGTIPKDPANKFIPYNPIKEIPYVSGYSEYVFDKTKSNKPDSKDPDNLYSAIMSVKKAIPFQKDEFKKLFQMMRNWSLSEQNYRLHLVFLQPIIVFSGKLFVTDISGKKDSFESVKYVQMPRGFVTKDYDERSGAIHIVQYDSLEEYLMMVRKHFGKWESNFGKYQTELKSAFSNIK